VKRAGQVWEALAERRLQAAGLSTLARNWRCRHGELDLVMRDGDSLIFVEVRYRTGGGFGDGVASIHPGKQRRLIAAASLFLQSHPALARLPCRFDVVALGGREPEPEWTWLRGAFEASA
jgi:putative endonuclease